MLSYRQLAIGKIRQVTATRRAEPAISIPSGNPNNSDLCGRPEWAAHHPRGGQKAG